MKMKEKLKRGITFVLILSMVFSIFMNISVDASETLAEGEWLYEIVDGDIVISGYTGEKSDLTIPSVINGKQVKEIGYQVFQNHHELMSVTISEGIEKIGYSAFAECSNLEKVVLSDTVKSIEGMVFDNCTKLSDVTFPEHMDFIGEYAFFGTNLVNVKIPDGVKSIEEGVFQYCNSLKNIMIPESVQDIDNRNNFGYSAFLGCAKLENVHVDEKNSKYSSKDGVLYTKDKKGLLFYPFGKGSVEFIVLDVVEYIDSDVFRNHVELERIVIPDSVKVIGSYSFSGCANLKEIHIPDGVTIIPLRAFSGCCSLESINIPNSVKSIGSYAFSGCSALKEIKLPKSVDNISYISDFEKVEGPQPGNGVTCFRGCSSLEKIIVDSENSKYSSEKGVLYNKNKSAILFYPEGQKDTEFVIPDGVQKIEENTFYSCMNLKKVTIPKSVVSVSDSSFVQCENFEIAEFIGKKPENLNAFCKKCNVKLKILYPRKYELSWKHYSVHPIIAYGEPWIGVQRISIDKSQFTITKGKSRQLKMAISPAKADDKSVVWSTSNPKVATVSQTGVVKAKGKGTCIISVITNEGKKKATCKVTVTVPVKKLKLNKSKVSIKKGKTYKLRCMITPKNATNKKIVWSSTNKKIAKVTKGKIKARKKGKCYVIVKTKDGKRKAKCKVVVK